MRIVIAPDKFKGSLDAIDAAQAIADGARHADADLELDLCPIADGGEGTVATLVAATGGRLHSHRVTGPLPEMKVDATFGMLGDGLTAVIEMAAASGLSLLQPADRNPLATTTFGTGELIRHAVQRGARKILLGIGGSATTDAGIGCAQACGLTILTRDGTPVSMSEPLCGRDLPNVLTIKRGRGEITNGIEMIVACDVTNPLYGPNGAAKVYGPQKGASPADIDWLDAELHQFSIRSGKSRFALYPGAGAAGGLGFGMLAFFDAQLRSGSDVVLEAVKLKDRLQHAALCITGEGRFDHQSLAGKATIGVARLCKAIHIPCIVIAGVVDVTDASEHGVTAAVSLMDASGSLDDAIREASIRIKNAGERVVRDFLSRQS